MIQVRAYFVGWRHAFPGLDGQKPIAGGTIRRSILGGCLAWGRYDDGERFLMIGPGEIRVRRFD